MAHRVAEAAGVLPALAAGAVRDAVAEGLGLAEGQGAVEDQFHGEEGGRPVTAHAADAAVVQGIDPYPGDVAAGVALVDGDVSVDVAPVGPYELLDLAAPQFTSGAEVYLLGLAHRVEAVLGGTVELFQQVEDRGVGADQFLVAPGRPGGAHGGAGGRLQQADQGAGGYVQDVFECPDHLHRLGPRRYPFPALPVAEAGHADLEALFGQVVADAVQGEAAASDGRAQRQVERAGAQRLGQGIVRRVAVHGAAGARIGTHHTFTSAGTRSRVLRVDVHTVGSRRHRVGRDDSTAG
ncbi:hypothetical protein [Streptomyces tendae]|uniref:hypothetical protein n=1 Tax=Streptomyces tendae TaxID=1932 RepID=UPI00368C68E3